MSKTYHRNKKLEFRKTLALYEEDHQPKDVPEECQWISMGGWNWDCAMKRCTKKRGASKHRHSLKREYKKFNCNTLDSWGNPVGERHEQSDRLHKIKHDATHRRRHKMKIETQRIIENSI